jgi:polysaccharide export outer membrane protein
MKKIAIYFSVFFLVTSCVSRKKIVYLQGSQNSENSSYNYEPLIQKDDILYINISTDEPSASVPFNLDEQAVSMDGAANSSNNFAVEKQTYLVDTMGNIDFPIIGTISVAGYSLNDVKGILKEKLSLYLKNPVINLRIMNFKVTVLGEVTKPGEVRVQSQRITLLDALSSSGDMTIYGRRDNVLLIRDFQGIKSFNRIDLTKADFVNSPFYYLDQNDVIYVEPRKSKIDSTTFGSNLTTIISLLGFVLTTTLILTKK